MGQSKGGGYDQVPTLPPQILQLLNQMAQQGQTNTQQAAQGYQDFLPGGKGGQPIIDAAMKRYQQQTVPGLLNALGSESKSSSALNQALGASAADLNTNLGAQLAEMQLKASQGLGNIGANQQNLATQTPQFALERNQPWWQKAIKGGVTGAAAGAPFGPWGAAIGGGVGTLGGLF